VVGWSVSQLIGPWMHAHVYLLNTCRYVCLHCSKYDPWCSPTLNLN